MKKLIFTWFLTLILFFVSEAQENRKLFIGAYGGTSLGFLKDDLRGTYLKPAPQLNLEVIYQLNKNWSFSLGPGYSMRHLYWTKTEQSSFLGSIKPFISELLDTSLISLTAGYINDTIYTRYKGVDKIAIIEMPLMAKFSYKKFIFQAGVCLNYTLSSTTNQEISSEIPLLKVIEPAIDSLGFTGTFLKGIIQAAFPGYQKPVIEEVDSRSSVIDLDIAARAGVSWVLADKYTLNLFYTQGFRNYRDAALTNKTTLNAVQLTLGYRF